jgi:cysteine synthase B
MRQADGTRSAQTADLTAVVGKTPLVDLSRLSLRPGVRLAGKCEWFNPGGSVKDRPALWMIRDGLERGALRPGMTILDATSGNTGIGLAWIGAALGFPVELCLPVNANAERRAALLAYGARLVDTDALEGTDGAQREAKRRAAADPGRYFHVDQYANPANVRAHYESTGPELLAQTGGAITHFVAGLGTTGTMMGTGRRLKEHDARIRLVAVQPDGPLHGLEGLKHLATAAVPAIYDEAVPDEQWAVTTEEAHATCRRAAREAGLWIGPSAGAALAAAVRLSGTLESGWIVALLCDSGARYAGDRFWREEP